MRVTPGTVIIGIFAVLFGLVGTFGIKQYLTPAAAITAARRPAPIRLPFASADLEPGKTIRLGDIKIRALTPEEASSSFPSGEAMTQAQQIIGRVVKEPIKKDEAFRIDHMYPEGTGPHLDIKLRPGYRAITIPVEGAGAVAGFATPGTIVDVLFRARKDDGVPEATITLVHGAEVLALGEMASPGGRGSGTAASVTIAVPAADAMNLKAVEGHGQFSLTLRSRDEATDSGDRDMRTLSQVLGLKDPVPAEARHEIEIFRGTAKEVVSFSRSAFSVGRGEPKQSPAPTTPDLTAK